MSFDPKISRRSVLGGLAALAVGATAATMPRRARAQAAPNPDRKFLIVVTCTGGASLVDAMLAVRESECPTASTLNVYPDAMVQGIEGTPFRVIDQRLDDIGPLPYSGQANQSDFVRRHAAEMCVVTYQGTSVNHLVAEKRTLTGNDAWSGRTLQEICAATYGQGLPLPNVNMGVGGFIEPGIDVSLPSWARAEPVTNALTWPFGLHGSRGLKGAPAQGLIDKARKARAEIETRSAFDHTFTRSELLALWKTRREQATQVEAQDLITRLNFVTDSPQTPLHEFGLGSSEDAALLARTFPLAATDPLEAQAALAYLLIKNGISVTVTLGPSLSPNVGGQQIVDSPPLAFDFSHSSHRAAQAIMWSRLLSVANRLIDLLSAVEYGDGKSYWDHSLMYFASDFGRSRGRAENATDFGSGHHINNGALLVSPLVRGNTVLGGVDPATTLTYGFDPMTGAPQPGRNMAEAEIFAGIVGALGVDTSGTHLPSVPVMSRA